MRRWGAAGFRHFDFEAEAKTFFFGRHEALGLQDLLASAEVEFQRNRLPGCLQLAAHDADDAFQNLFLDLGDGAGNFAALAFPAQHDVDDGESDGEIELEHSRGPDRGEIDGGKVGFFGDALDELEEGEMLGGNQAAVENDAQVGHVAFGVRVGMSRLEAHDRRPLIRNHRRHAHRRRAFALQAGEREREAGNTLRLKYHQLAAIRAARRGACGLGVGHVAGHHLRALPLGPQRRATEFQHAEQVHDVLPPPLMAEDMV